MELTTTSATAGGGPEGHQPLDETPEHASQAGSQALRQPGHVMVSSDSDAAVSEGVCACHRGGDGDAGRQDTELRFRQGTG